MDLKAGYFVGNLIIFIPWLVIFMLRQDLRKEMLWGGLLGLPLVFTAPLFIPEYWNPPYLFGFIPNTKIGVEDVMFAFFPGGIAAVVFEFIESKRLVKFSRKKSEKHLHFIPYLLAVVVFVGLEFIWPGLSIYNLMAGCLLGTIYMAYHRKDLVHQMLLSGFLFMLLYFLMFTIFNYVLYPGYIQKVYSLHNLTGFKLFRLPLEEYLFALCAGLSWSVLYEYIFNYKTTDS